MSIYKVFVSYHHSKDQLYRNYFDSLFEGIQDVTISKAAQIGEIDAGMKTEAVRQVIRDEYLLDSTVTIVLVGAETWKRKHVDWEIAASIRDTRNNPRSGLLGIVLPTYPRLEQTRFDPHTIPPRLYNNMQCGFAQLHNWIYDPAEVQKWIQEAFETRNKVTPDNSFPPFADNHSGKRWGK